MRVEIPDPVEVELVEVERVTVPGKVLTPEDIVNMTMGQYSEWREQLLEYAIPPTKEWMTARMNP